MRWEKRKSHANAKRRQTEGTDFRLAKPEDKGVDVFEIRNNVALFLILT